ncbi:Stp1/IreP family PP2C-type Ser/Thr phosphatase [Arabiibacter massiliensis]|uniref:Stp1/IreP family PP2C-type Ser/Thr phosphatase n=1 Tax=Arabiibacter massiliensis TaxID=1870985 RepID=UPI0009BAF5B5|nr:Stp1/IreP family PP2C-type Ser/Thr phosphatase [Arabiibacter massiliensis]
MAADRAYKSTPRTRKGALTSFGSRTDIGCLRDHNEDSLIVTPPLFAVADGMGGHAAGEVASEIAVNVLSELAPAHPDGEALAHAVEEANRAIIRAAHEGLGREGMGTTMTAAMLEGERLVIAQVGDSRAYLLHQGKLQQLTRDHSLMADMIEAGQLTPEEARTHPNRSVITRALGSDLRLHPDIYEINVETGDRLLVCSDGLSGMVMDQDIENILCRIHDPQRCASQLVNEAIANGGHDNVTVIVADVTGFAEARRKKMARKTKISIAIVLVLFAAIVAGAAWGSKTYLDTVAYLADDNGKVAIYRGMPGSLFGLSFSSLERTTDVPVDQLQPGVANRLASGIRVDDVAAAEALVKEYEAEVAAKQGGDA